MTRKWLHLIACAAAFAVARAQPVQPEVCGYVYSLQGSWRIAPQYVIELKQGMAVHAGDRIQLKSSGRPAHLDIGLLNGTVFSRNCDTEQDCQGVDTMTAVTRAKTLTERLIGMMSGFSARQPPLVFTLTRGDGPRPEEAVLRRTRGTVDLAPALRSTASGTFEVALFPAGEERSIAQVPCRWMAPHGACALEAPKAGLYKLQLSAADAPPAAVLVLIADAPDYAPAAAAFADAARVADAWGEGVRPATRHYFLSSVLNQLASERVH
jgi:hypothetical protein